MRFWRRLSALLPATVMLVFGLPGHLDDAKTWSGWLSVIDTEWHWWNLLLVTASAIMFAFAVAPQSALTWVRNVAWPSKSAAHLSRQRNVDYTKPVDPKDWENVEVYSLYEAACLWVDVEPHDPIVDTRAKAQFFQLRSAMATGKLPYHKGMIRVLNEITGERSLPTGSSILAAIALRRYANSIGNVPAFLQSVKVPVEQEPGKDKEVG